MKLFIDRFSNLVKGTISGFDRIVFKGLLLPLMSASEVMTFCRYKGILNKDYKVTSNLSCIKNVICMVCYLNNFHSEESLMSEKKPNFKNAWKHLKTNVDKSNKSELETRIKIGRYNRLAVQTRSDFGVYLNSGEERVLLPNKYVPTRLSIGDFLDVFVYTDSEDRLVATTLKPAGVVGDFVFLIAKDVVSFGTFMDWGLEKDLLVPRNRQQDRMMPGKKYLVKICQDERTHRIYGTTLISANCDKNTKDLKVGQQVDLIVHSITTIGIMAVIDNRYYGMMYINETYQKLFIGDTCKGYIMRVREDGKIDLSMKKPGYSSVPKSAEVILYRLNKSGGFIPCHDKSSPEEIRKRFSMSKKEFKRAVGSLYKKRMIVLKNNGIGLIK
jgi:uncharacterized protein